MLNRNIETFIACDREYTDSDVVIFGAPFDSTTSYRPGTRFASRTMRAESYGLETYSPYQDRDLEDTRVFDGGDLELCFGDTSAALRDIEAFASTVLGDGKIPLMIGGEHLVTLGAVRAAVKKYGDLHIVHFDAHADLRDDYLGAKTVARHRTAPRLGPGWRRKDLSIRHTLRRQVRVFMGKGSRINSQIQLRRS